ncbi:ubiquitin-protein ligase [Punctularia strigosozonata HHB-11173 SS5]|uniref:ubiquitin-protein ligase n=1 Tax=Punctularia strigosozonata (strain HHB-11173) TaxID=741275 RepID=UPI0004416C3A|nr:ubiquitin-protein ligase [Punctularia strigosozonata HHB-11173 SS5]EIN12815.1 ubiquitin-protein ligase [Punctularia strigosozonata HHB-11173 SS5]
MSEWQATQTSTGIRHIALLIRRLADIYQLWAPMHELGLSVVYTNTFQAQVHSRLPAEFAKGFKELIAWTILPPTTEGMPAEVQDPNLWSSFETLGLVDRYEMLIASVCYEYIETKVTEMCAGKWDEAMLPMVRSWMARDVVSWMLKPYARGAKTMEEARTMLQGVGSRFDFHACKVLCDLRTSEIFDIIVDYPDSVPALGDLKECLLRVDQRAQLVQALRKANKKRLLHPGADTRDILTQYVSTIRCLRIIDPPGVLLFKVADPIRRYLRERPDTIRCIVASLVGDDSSGDSLVDSDEPPGPLQQAVAEDYTDPNWEPDPIDAGPDFRANKPSDIISTLVSIYPSHDLFVKELQILLAQRLLNIKDGNFVNERRNIELLKVRFGEAPLQVCEVMLKDMTDSRRTDEHIQAQNSSVLHPTILSQHFWPALQSSGLNLPSQLQSIQQEYTKQFTTFKPDKKLRWLPHLGTVDLELQLEDRTVNAEVTPLEAALIEHFSEKPVWDIDDLVKILGSVDRTVVLKALITWEDLGVLAEDGETTYRLLEVAEPAGSSRRFGRGASGPGKPAEEVAPVASVQQQQAEQMRVYWKFIEGMLTNLGGLGLDRIQTMLKFAAPGYDRSPDQLATFMEAARSEGLVIAKDGIWRLNK